MNKTTVIVTKDTPKTLPERIKDHNGRSFRYFLAIVPFILVLLISTSYQQNHDDVNYFERNDFAPEVKDSLKEFLMKIPVENLPFKPGKAEWAFLKSFYHDNGYRPLWIHLKGLDDGTLQLTRLIEDAMYFGLEPETYHHSAIRDLIKVYNEKEFAAQRVFMDFNLEILLTDAAFRLMFNLQSGYLPFDSSFSSEIAVNSAVILKNGVAGKEIYKAMISVEPKFSQYQNLRHALSGFIAEHSLKDSKVTDTVATREFLYNYRRLALNLDRLRKRNFTGDRMLYVNIPSFSLRIFENNMIRDTFRVIVGTPSSPTPLLSGNMESIIANPVWYVPRSIAIDEILPKLKNDSLYLEKNGFSILDRNYRVVDGNGVSLKNMDPSDFDYTFRQKRGADNSLGKAKFLFSNPYSVYLHDTPSRSLFSKEKRAFSHGCIRLQNPERLANYILQEINADTTSFENVIEKGLHREFTLRHALPIHITYITCEADTDGGIKFYDDIYGLDETAFEELQMYMNVN